MSREDISIFIASAAEVKEEREKSIQILNHINKSHTHLNLEPIHWEYDMGGGNNPGFENNQDAINPKLEKSAICIFIFYSKLGKYTHEEFKLAIEKGKKILVYYKKGFYSEVIEEMDLFKELIVFKKNK